MPKGILTVSLNAAVDVSYRADGFGVGKINLVSAVTRVAGGKANNVARVLASLGQHVIATGFAGGAAGRFIQADLAHNGVQTDYEEMAGENRTCIAVVDPVGQTLTEVREQGPTITAAEADRFLTRFRRLVREVELVVIAGSLPPGIPVDFYNRLVREAYQAAQVRTLVDASGAALNAAIAAQPYFVKPNQEELEEWAGTKLDNDAAILAAAQRLMDAGPLVVAVSLGKNGLLLVSPEGAWRAVPPDIQPVNTVGSGDSLVAGFAAGLLQGLSADAVLRLAVGCGTANALTESVALVQQADLDRIRTQVRIHQIR